MTVDITAAIEEGLSRVGTPTGGILAGAIVVVGVASTVVENSLNSSVFLRADDEILADAAALFGMTVEEYRQMLEAQHLLEFPVGVLVALAIVAWLVRLLVKIGAMRWFVEEDAASPLTMRLFSRRVLWTVGNLIVGVILYAVVVGIGLVLLVVPGIFLAVSLFFFNYEIVVEGENAIDALVNSYELSEGHRVRLFLLGFLYTVVGGVVGALSSLAGVGNPVFGMTVSGVVAAAYGFLGIAIAAAVYNQLRMEPDEEEIGALGPDDL